MGRPPVVRITYVSLCSTDRDWGSQAALTQQNVFASNVFRNNSGEVFDQGGAHDFWLMSNSFDQPTAVAAARIEGVPASAVSLLDP